MLQFDIRQMAIRHLLPMLWTVKECIVFIGPPCYIIHSKIHENLLVVKIYFHLMLY